jgi:hypothetical protein
MISEERGLFQIPVGWDKPMHVMTDVDDYDGHNELRVQSYLMLATVLYSLLAYRRIDF